MLALSDPLPLRDTSAWGAFADLRALPWVFGEVEVLPVQYDQTGVTWCVGDGPSVGLLRAEVDDRVVDARFRGVVDLSGQPVSLIDLAQPLPAGAQLRVWMRGMPDPRTGGTLANPADVIAAILRLSGRELPDHRIADFRRECHRADLSCALVLSDLSLTIRGAIDLVCNSVGAVWSLDRPTIARLYPPLEVL